jgi:hypothetical protein
VITFAVDATDVRVVLVGMWDSLREQFPRCATGVFTQLAAAYVRDALRGRFMKAITYAGGVPVRGELRWRGAPYRKRVYVPPGRSGVPSGRGTAPRTCRTFQYVAFVRNRRSAPRRILLSGGEG